MLLSKLSLHTSDKVKFAFFLKCAKKFTIYIFGSNFFSIPEIFKTNVKNHPFSLGSRAVYSQRLFCSQNADMKCSLNLFGKQMSF